jgi:hypothetical protein
MDGWMDGWMDAGNLQTGKRRNIKSIRALRLYSGAGVKIKTMRRRLKITFALDQIRVI